MKPRVLAVLPHLIPTAEIYTLRPLAAMARQGLVEFEHVLEAEANLSGLTGWDAAVFVRNENSKYNFILEELKAQSTTILYDLDDNLWEVPENSPSKKYHQAEQIRQIEHYLRCADLVKVYNPLMAELVKEKFNPNVFLALAGIDMSLAPAEPPAPQPKKVQLVYATTRGAQDELYQVMLPDLRQALVDLADKVEFITWHACHPDLADLPNVRVFPAEADYAKYMTEFTRADYEIGLAPMMDSHFYRSKTNTKFRDYGLARMAGIYSDSPLYRDVQDGVTGLVVKREPGAWYAAICKLVEDGELRKSLQSAAFDYVKAHYRQEFMEQQWQEVLGSLGLGESTPDQGLAAGGVRVEVLAGRHTQDGLAAVESTERAGRQPLDLDASLPFADDRVDEFVAVESLETAKDLDKVMGEIYRVCRHGAVVKISARYGQNQAVMADPTVRQWINEQTPRFWTSAARSVVYEKDYAPDAPEAWGRLLPDSAKIDLRCTHLEFFYRPEYRGLSAEERRMARHKFLNVCDLMYACFVVNKPTAGQDERVPHTAKRPLLDPPQVQVRRCEEKILAQQLETDRLQAANRDLGSQVQYWKDQPYRQKALQLLSEYQALRGSRWIRNLLRFIDRSDQTQKLAPEFGEMLAANGQRSGYFLRNSLDLSSIDFIEYPIVISKPGLKEIHLAVNAVLPVAHGVVGIELVNPGGQIAAQLSRPASHIQENQPAVFPLETAIDSTGGTSLLRVFARGVDAPVSVYEYQKYAWMGLGPLLRKPFIRLVFGE